MTNSEDSEKKLQETPQQEKKTPTENPLTKFTELLSTHFVWMNPFIYRQGKDSKESQLPSKVTVIGTSSKEHSLSYPFYGSMRLLIHGDNKFVPGKDYIAFCSKPPDTNCYTCDTFFEVSIKGDHFTYKKKKFSMPHVSPNFITWYPHKDGKPFTLMTTYKACLVLAQEIYKNASPEDKPLDPAKIIDLATTFFINSAPRY